MSNIAYVGIPMRVVQALPTMKSSEFKTLSVIWSHLPRAFPSVATICRKAGLSHNTVRKNIKALIDKNILKRLTRIGSSNFYQINPMLLAKKMQEKVVKAVKDCVEYFNNKVLHTPYQKVVSPPLPTFGRLTSKVYTCLNYNLKPTVSLKSEEPFSLKSVLAVLGV